MILTKLKEEKILEMGGRRFQLIETTKDHLWDLRKSGKPGFVFKEGCKLWYIELPDNKSRFSKEEDRELSHICSKGKCKWFLDSNECDMATKLLFDSYRKDGLLNLEICKNECCMLEYIGTVTLGMEIFNVEKPRLKVFTCSRYTIIKNEKFIFNL